MKKSLSILREDNILLPSAIEMVKGGADIGFECTRNCPQNVCGTNTGVCISNDCKVNQFDCDINKCDKNIITIIKPGDSCDRATGGG